MRAFVIIVLALLLVSCATTPRGKLVQADDLLSSVIAGAGFLVEQGIIKDKDKPKLEACFKVAEAAIAESRAQLKAGVDSTSTYKLALKYIAVAQAFVSNQRSDLNVCTN